MVRRKRATRIAEFEWYQSSHILIASEAFGCRWYCADNGFYFGVPLLNFVGWFCTSTVIVALYLTAEFYMSKYDPPARSCYHWPLPLLTRTP